MIGADHDATERERALLHDTAALLSADLPFSRLLGRLCTIIQQYVDAPLISFALVRRARAGDRVAYAYRCDVGRMRDASSILERPDSRRALATEASILRTTGEDGSQRSTMTIPVRGGRGLRGLLVLEAPRENAFDSEDLRSLEAVARFLGVAIRSRRVVGVSAKVQRTPVIAGVVITALVFFTFILIFDYSFKAEDIRDHALWTQNERARNVAHQLDSTLAVAQQVVRSTAAMIDPIRGDRKRLEATLYQMLVSTPADTIWGIGAWYEPRYFDPRIDRFAPYVHRNPTSGASDILTYRYSTRDYDYLQRDWYRDGERALGKPILAPPNVDTDVAVISAVQGFYDPRSGHFGGTVTVNLGLRLLRTAIRHFNEERERLVYVTTSSGKPFIFPEEERLVAFAREHGESVDSALDVSPLILHDYITRTHAGRRFEVTVPVREAGWVVHVSTPNDRLFFAMQSLRDELTRALILLWLAATLALVMLRLQFLHGRRALGVEIEKTQLVNESVRREQVVRRLQRVAYYDPLTGLPNRAQILERIQGLLDRPAGSFAVLYLDLDRLNGINDRYGRQTGDHLLQGIAQRLDAVLPEHAFAGRISGDEFVVVVEQVDDPGIPVAVAREIVGQMMEPFSVGDYEISSPAQVGIALGPDGYERAVDIVRDADRAMDEARSMGRGGGERWQVFDRAMSARLSEELALERDLRRAIERSELRLHFQPIWSLDAGEIDGFEALLRWQHPRRGLLAPAEFLPVAERAGLMIEIGTWALGEAARCRAAFARKTTVAPELFVSVNLTAEHFADRRLPGTVNAVLKRTGIPPSALKLELTEGTLMEESNAVHEIFEELASAGVRAFVDDFGTGYSSLGYLHRFPLEALKIDRSFVSGVAASAESREIVRTIVALAGALHLKVTAEGIETREQVATLQELGVVSGQGFLLGKPVDADRAYERLVAVREGAA